MVQGTTTTLGSDLKETVWISDCTIHVNKISLPAIFFPVNRKTEGHDTLCHAPLLPDKGSHPVALGGVLYLFYVFFTLYTTLLLRLCNT